MRQSADFRRGKRWPLPPWLDDLLTVSHPVLPLAILRSLGQAAPPLTAHELILVIVVL